MHQGQPDLLRVLHAVTVPISVSQGGRSKLCSWPRGCWRKLAVSPLQGTWGARGTCNEIPPELGGCRGAPALPSRSLLSTSPERAMPTESQRAPWTEGQAEKRHSRVPAAPAGPALRGPPALQLPPAAGPQPPAPLSALLPGAVRTVPPLPKPTVNSQ